MTDYGNLRTLLGAFTAVPGVSGHEDVMATAFLGALAGFTVEPRIDALCNAIARVPPAPGAAGGMRIALAAHLDTVGLMVKRRNADGTLGVVRVGGLNLKAAPGAAVSVGGLPGMIAVRSQHLARAGEGIPDQDDLRIEIGAALPPMVTTPITFAPQTIEMEGGYYSSPYLDNRAGCAVLAEVARQIAGRTPHEVYLIGSAQEETTCAGAQAALAAIQPDAVIVVDGTLSYDTPEARGKGEVALGHGPVLLDFLYVSGMNGWHAHPRLKEHLANVAAGLGIAVQYDAVHGLMSDARATQPLAIPSALVGLPMRGKHGPLETVQLDDLAGVVALLTAVLLAPLPSLTRGVPG
ncbi:MAG: M20/M25/M40 family metallo-hydrolase [Anaerolineae bacterium]|nr:M20/M25/M40 family metallo-hydrolase [Anaerolineae bacterium]